MSSNADFLLTSNLPVAVMQDPECCRQNETSSKKEKDPKLPPECRIPIFKFLPTSELVRFVSKTRPLLGEFWSHELKFVAEQRLPFGVHLNQESLLGHPDEEPINAKFELFDCLGNKIAEIKHPEMFQYSHLCELAELTFLPAKRHATDLPFGALYGFELLAPLCNLRSLTLLFVPNPPVGSTELPLEMSSLSPDIQQVLSQVESLRLLGRPCYPPSINTHLLRCFVGFKKLDIGLEEFYAVMPAMVPFKRLLALWTLPQDEADTLMRLDSLNITIRGDFYCSVYSREFVRIMPMRQILHFLGTKCFQLIELSLPLVGEVSLYTQAFRAMPNLVKLALDTRFLGSLESNGLIEREEPIITVKDLSIAGHGHYSRLPSQQAILLAVLAKFPHVRKLSINVPNISETLQLATDVLSRQLFPCIAFLELINGVTAFPFSLRELQPLLENPNLPSCLLILLSKSFLLLAKDPDVLASLYSIMKTNPVQRLLMKGPLHPQALLRLEKVLSEDREVTRQAKVLAWTDKELPKQHVDYYPPLDLLDFTDVKIKGVKNAGPQFGKEFSIRIFHQETSTITHLV